MPIDPNIIAGLKPAQIQQSDPLERYGKSLALKNLMMQGDAAERGLADDEAVRGAYQQAGGDSARLRALLQSGGQHKQLQALDKFELEKRDKEASIGSHNATAGKANYDVEKDKIERTSALLSVARDQPTWDAVRRVMIVQNPAVAEHLPAQFDPTFVQTQIAKGQTIAQRLEDQRKREELALKGANEPFAPGPSGPVANPLVQEFQLDKAKKSAPNVTVKTDVKTGESLAGQIGPMMKDSTAIAEGAVKQVDAAQRIIKAVDGGQLFAGPLADKRVTLAQVGQVLGVGGKDDAEKLTNTRQAVRGLAELTLQGRQQMKGQGAITESEGKLAEKAMSGDISQLTVPEIRQLARASERAARFNHAEHVRKLTVMQNNPELQQLSPFYQGPAMPGEIPDPQPAGNSGGGIKFLGFEG